MYLRARFGLSNWNLASLVCAYALRVDGFALLEAVNLRIRLKPFFQAAVVLLFSISIAGETDSPELW